MKRFTPLHAILGVSALLLAVGLAYSVRGAIVDWGRDPRHAEEAGRAVAEAERSSGRIQREYRERRFDEADARARAALADARTRLAACESRVLVEAGKPELDAELVAAAVAFGRYLDLHPGDVDVLLLRARAWELRRFADKAAADLKRAVELKPELAGSLAERLKRAQAGFPLK